MTVLSEISSNN